MTDPGEGGAFPIESVNAALHELLTGHAPCRWKQVGPCVYCEDHGIRLYNGELPPSKRTTPVCPDGEHEWDEDMGLGFYFLCKRCGFKEWAD